MKQLVKRILKILGAFGFSPVKTVLSLRGLPAYIRDFRRLRNQKSKSGAMFRFGKLYPCLSDRYSESGSAKGHYFHQDLLVARRVYARSPQRHLDVGSRIDGFVAHVAAFREISVVDIRALSGRIPNIVFIQADMMSALKPELTECCDSLSCLHAIEHFGLGRYGDPVNGDGHLLGLDNLHRMLKAGGRLYLSTPIGPQRIEFNAHRVFAVGYLLECFRDRFQVEQFSYVDDKGDLHENAGISPEGVANSYGCTYGCGIFELVKL